jgi:hypothetical protein
MGAPVRAAIRYTDAELVAARVDSLAYAHGLALPSHEPENTRSPLRARGSYA